MSAGRHPRPRRAASAPVMRSALLHRGYRTPQWFHGLLDRGVAEDLLLKSPARPKEGLFLVRQSSNRGGCFVISVCTGYSVNHYLIETLESMFYVKRESGGERGRDIQACDLVNLVECYKRLPLDISDSHTTRFRELRTSQHTGLRNIQACDLIPNLMKCYKRLLLEISGLTLHQPLLRTTPLVFTTSLSPTPSSTKDNHNYIPLYVDHRYYIGKEDYRASDLEAASFHEGEPVTIILKETKKWWFGFNSKGDLGYVPSGLLSPNYDTELVNRLSDGVASSEEDERVEISEFAKTESDESSSERASPMEVQTMQESGKTRQVLDANSNIVVDEALLQEGSIHGDSIRWERQGSSEEFHRVPTGCPPKEPATSKELPLYVSSEYITACVQNHEQKLVKELIYTQRRQVVATAAAKDTGGDREWVFRENMDVALLKEREEEQIVPDVMDMETDSPLPSLPAQLGHVSEAFEEDLWAEHNQSWNLPMASGGVVVSNAISQDSLSSCSSEGASSARTESTSNLSAAYDPVETYLRLCDCWSRPVPISR